MSITTHLRTAGNPFSPRLIPAVGDDDVSISGGAMEIILSGDTATLTFSGATGVRTFTLPRNWNVSGGVTQNGRSYAYNYAGGNVTIVLSGSGARSPSPPH
jgi:hypothetical protein